MRDQLHRTPPTQKDLNILRAYSVGQIEEAEAVERLGLPHVARLWTTLYKEGLSLPNPTDEEVAKGSDNLWGHVTPSRGVMRAYSEGRIGQRDAIERLGLRDYASLLIALGNAEMPMPLPPEEDIQRQAAAFVQLFRGRKKRDQ